MAKLFKQPKSNDKSKAFSGIPNIWVKTNQFFIAALTLIGLLTSNFWIIAFVLVSQLVPYKFGVEYNIFIRFTRFFWKNRLNPNDVQAFELAKFNQTLAILMLFASVFFGALNLNIVGYIFGGMVTAAATVAVLGYCIGCTIYFQYKQLKARRSA